MASICVCLEILSSGTSLNQNKIKKKEVTKKRGTYIFEEQCIAYNVIWLTRLECTNALLPWKTLFMVAVVVVAVVIISGTVLLFNDMSWDDAVGWSASVKTLTLI